jgi:hypothetical protein
MSGRESAYLTEALPYVQEIEEAEQRAVLRIVESEIKAGNLTGDLAVSLWHQYLACSKMTQAIYKRIRLAGLTEKTPASSL